MLACVLSLVPADQLPNTTANVDIYHFEGTVAFSSYDPAQYAAYKNSSRSPKLQSRSSSAAEDPVAVVVSDGESPENAIVSPGGSLYDSVHEAPSTER